VTEEKGLKESFGKRSAVESDDLTRATAPGVDEVSEEFFTSAGLASDEDGGRCAGNAMCLAQEYRSLLRGIDEVRGIRGCSKS
jgi:hypothetical protein